MSHHYIEATRLSFTYSNGVIALDSVSFRAVHGESVGIVGPNGAGKSTLLLHVNGVLLPDSGTMNIGGTVVTKKTAAELRRRVGLVFQDPDDQLFMQSVSEDVGFGPRNLGLAGEELDARISESLATVGITHLAERRPDELSGGEKRLAAIAGVLAMQPDVLVLDEPSAGLDPRARRNLIELLREFSHTRLIATHDLDLVWDICSRTIILYKGKVAADGPTEEILADRELLEKNGMELPLRLQGCPVCGGEAK